MLKVTLLVALAATLASASYPAANYDSIVHSSVEPIHHEESHKALVIPGPLRITSLSHKPASIQVIRHTVNKPAVVRHQPVVVVRRRKPIIKKPVEEYGVPIHHTSAPFIPEVRTTTLAPPQHEYGLPIQTHVNFNEGGKYPYAPAVVPVKNIEIPQVPSHEYGPPKIEIPAQKYGVPKIVQPIPYVPRRPEAFGYAYSIYSNPGYHYNQYHHDVPVAPATHYGPPAAEYGPPKEAVQPFVPHQQLPLVDNHAPFALHQYHTNF